MAYDWDTRINPRNFNVTIFGGKFDSEILKRTAVYAESEEVTIAEVVMCVWFSHANAIRDPRKHLTIRCFDQQAGVLDLIARPCV